MSVCALEDGLFP